MTQETTSIRIDIESTALRRYIQDHPFMTGPDENINRAAIEAVRTSIVKRISPPNKDIFRVPASKLSLQGQDALTARRLLLRADFSEQKVQKAEHDFSWRVNNVPNTARTILAIGVGTGEELAFLHAKAPDAQITVLEYVDMISPALRTALPINLVIGDVMSLLKTHQHIYDVIFCNHTIEHMYQPDGFLQLLYGRLKPAGILVAGLPLDGDSTTPFYKVITKLLQNPERIHEIDCILLDAGHPWKTNPSDLTESLQRTGFNSIIITQRLDFPYRSRFTNSLASTFIRALGLSANLLTFQTLRFLTKSLYRGRTPLRVRRIIFSMDRRVFFGTNRIKNAFSPDVVLTARRH